MNPRASNLSPSDPSECYSLASLVCGIFLVLVLLGAVGAARGEEDIRERFGTRSMGAARLIEAGMQKVEAKQTQDALKLFEEASAADPSCEFAAYWTATAAADLGDVERSIELYKAIVDRGLRTGPTSVSVDAAINLGLIHAQLGDEEKATHFFSQAILLDPKDEIKLAYKAYRNMAVAFSRRNQPLSAAICVVKAFEANPEMIPEQMVVDMLDAVGTEEVGTPLNFAKSAEDPKPRREPIEASPLSVSGAEEEIVDIQVDPVQNRVFAFGKDLAHYFFFDGKVPELAVKVPVEGTIAAACANAGHLYLMLQNPAVLAKVEPVTGKVEKQWPLNVSSHSVAVYPIQNLAFFPLGGVVHILNLRTSELTPTDNLATRMRVDPRQRFCFSDIHPGFRETGGHMIVNGQPIFLQIANEDRAQTALVRSVLAQNDLVVSSFRLNAASNGRALHVSPDGKWVAEIGGGGWRPANPEGKSGYGVAVFCADDLNHLQGFYPTEAYPHGAAVNPIAGIVAVFNKEKVNLYDLASPTNPVELNGEFAYASSWDAEGLTLYAAAKTSGITAFQIARSESEVRVAKSWVEPMKESWPLAMRIESEIETAAEPLNTLEQFEPKATKEEVISLIRTAQREGRTDKPIYYRTYGPYISGATERADLEEGFDLVLGEDAGVGIFKVRKLLEADPRNPALLFTLGLGYFQTAQLDKALASQLEALHLDAGRTSLSIEALRNLAYIHKRKMEPLPAAKCYAAALLLDKVNPKHAREAAEFFREAGVLDEAKELLEPSASLLSPGSAGSSTWVIPKLPVPTVTPEMDSVTLFATTVSSVVLVETSSGSGSGVCIADGAVLTNHHVVAGASTGIAVYPFDLSTGKVERLASQAARVLFSDPVRDVALLALENPPATLKPLALATELTRAGTPVYALGSPGLGQQVLAQSITEGIVSSAERSLGGQTYIQHTAAVNPGNSGGPLLNRQGHVIGINTTKPALENVGFAIPATAIRELLEAN